MHRPAVAVDDPLGHEPALLVGTGEEAYVLGGEIRIEAGDEDRRTQDLGEAGGVVLEGIARRRPDFGVQFERLGARDQGSAGAGDSGGFLRLRGTGLAGSGATAGIATAESQDQGESCERSWNSRGDAEP